MGSGVAPGSWVAETEMSAYIGMDPLLLSRSGSRNPPSLAPNSSCGVADEPWMESTRTFTATVSPAVTGPRTREGFGEKPE